MSLIAFHQTSEEGLFEGCGREGPILSIFIAEFHHIAGPKIVYQYPPVIQKEVFDSVSTYIIPKTHLQRITMTVNVLGKKIIGYPIQIQDDKYERNAFYFNTCFVCDAWARTVQYERVLVKLAEFFNSLELEIEYLSKKSESCSNGILDMELELKDMFNAILNGINGPQRECSYVFQNRLLALKVVPAVLSDPPWVDSHTVPVFVTDVGPIERWDLTTQQIIPYVDGFNHVAQISHIADVHINLVKTCLQNLLYYNLIKMIPAFQYSNMYCITPSFHSKLMLSDNDFKNDCITFAARIEHVRPSFGDVVRFYCSLKRGVTVKELCLRFRQVAASAAVRVLVLDSKYSSSKYSDQSLSSSAQSRTSSNPTTPIKMHTQSLSTRASISKRHMSEFQSVLSVIDERKLIQFGLLHNLIRRIEKYPVFLKKEKEVGQQGLNALNPNRNSSGTGASQQFQTPLQSAYSTNGSMIPHGSSSEPVQEATTQWEKYRKKLPNLYAMFNGSNSYDKICLAHGLSQNELDEITDRDPDVVTIWK
ncbi:Nitrogen permease regulator 2-like protein [Orchesella cincta]|uniref:Nitrogen permease regulator 2-like protein n=1 Tax=Orchesella cincta TaxID=48709 RepID=A0A1D2NIB8_ORCCI|nr:Nitrogen permease regulator 2-like protein [Orchesella cincta]